MRIAIQICGLLRTWKYVESNFYDNVIKPNLDRNNQIDIFIYTNFNDKKPTLSFQYITPTLIIQHNDDTQNILLINTDFYSHYNTYKNIYLHYQKIRECNFIRKQYQESNKHNYDVIFKTRADLYYHTPVHFKITGDGVINISKPIHSGIGEPSDLCFYSNPTTMDSIVDKFVMQNTCPHTILKSYHLEHFGDVDIVRDINNDGTFKFNH